MQIYYDNQYTQELTERIEKKFWEENEDRGSVHLSDLCHCPMKAWCRLVGLPNEKEDGSVGIMMIGVVGQGIIQDVYPEEQREYEPDKDLPSHIDIFADFKFPVEIKWSRKNVTRGTDIEKSWSYQVTGYMAKTNSLEGKMVIFNIISGRLNAFKVVMTQEELNQRLMEMNTLRDDIVVAVKTKNPTVLPIWEEECAKCTYRPTRKKTKDGIGDTCPRYVKVKALASPDQSLS